MRDDRRMHFLRKRVVLLALHDELVVVLVVVRLVSLAQLHLGRLLGAPPSARAPVGERARVAARRSGWRAGARNAPRTARATHPSLSVSLIIHDGRVGWWARDDVGVTQVSAAGRTSGY